MRSSAVAARADRRERSVVSMGIIRSGNRRFDASVPVVVIGAGACGCSAALAANERSADVLVIERNDPPAGSTSLSGGQIPAAGTKLQRSAGIEDTPEEFAAEILEKARHQTDAEMALSIARGSTVTVDWLADTYGAPLELLIGWPSITEGGIMVNASGRRFSHENRGYSEQAIEVIRQPGKFAWTIFNERAHEVAMQFHHQRESVEAGAIRVADTFDRLVEITALPAGALAATLAEVNDVLAGRSADRFGRTFGDKAPLEPPYFAVKVTGALFHTQGGLVVDTGARVLRKGTRRALPNLSAGGGAARGLSGPSCWGYTSGAGLMTATTLGRVAGEGAAAIVS